MSKFVTFVVCRHDGCNRNFLFYAPSCTGFAQGDKVVVETHKGEQTATVVTSCFAFTDSDIENALRTLCAAEDREIKRVLGKFSYTAFEYEKDEKDGEDHESDHQD